MHLFIFNTECPKGTYKEMVNNTAACTDCPKHSTTQNEGSTSVWNCECDQGFEKNGTSCSRKYFFVVLSC